jgi:hypothetical protein
MGTCVEEAIMSNILLTAKPIDRRTFLAGTASSLLLTACGGSNVFAAPSRPNLILFNANVWTGDAANPRAGAVAIAGNRIHSVGASSDLRRNADGGTRIVDLGGRFVMPGFNDSHLHISYMAANIDDVRLLGAENIVEVLERIRERAANTPSGEWVLGNAQWHETLLTESRMPTRWELDSVAPNNPVYIPRGGHVAVVNSRALEIAGLTSDEPDPPGGLYVRNVDGELTGTLLESAKWSFVKFLPPVGNGQLRSALRRQLNEFSELGITSLTNPGTTQQQIALLRELHEESPLGVRIHWTVGGDRQSVAESVARFVDGYRLDSAGEVLKFTGLGEVGVDGGIEGAYLREPYRVVPGEQEDPAYLGVLFERAKDSKKLERIYLDAMEAGYTVMTHVTGDAGLDVALEILGRVREKKSFDHLRWTLHGCFLTDDTQLAEVKRLGLYITGQTQPYLLGWQMAKWWGRERADRSMPFRAFLDAGIPVGGGSDAPAGIANPLESIGWMVNRTCLGGLQFDQQWSITPNEALRLYTHGSAETQFMDDKLGVLKAGMLADIAILDQDPTAVEPESIDDIKVGATIMDGRPVFDRHGLLA